MNEKDGKPTPQEIVVVHRSESERQSVPNKVEQLIKILSVVAIPLVIAVMGWMIQNVLSQRSLGKDYVQLAVTILTKESKSVDPALREWAVDLLNDNSPTKFGPEITRKLKTGELNLSDFMRTALASAGGGMLATSPDGKTIATGHEDGTVRVWKLETGGLIGELREHQDAVTSVAFSPDGRLLISGSMDRTACLWDLEHMRIVAKLMAHNDGVIGVGILPDGRTAMTRSIDGTLVVWNIITGKILRRIRLGKQ